jgi:cbb3-type cytochrome oxidase maturation protein
MSVIYILLPVALILATAAVIAFVRAVRAGQFDDLETPRWRVLTDEDPAGEGADSGSCDGVRPVSRPRDDR